MNAFMKCVYCVHMMIAYYPAEIKTLCWYKKLFVHVVHMLLLNVHLLYNKNANRKMLFYDFRQSVLENFLPQKEEAQPALLYVEPIIP